MATDTSSRRAFRELARRANGGLEVTLFWSEFEDRLAVTVSNSRSGEWFFLDAESDNALDVFTTRTPTRHCRQLSASRRSTSERVGQDEIATSIAVRRS
jgi:hypothetical protein